MNYQKMPSPIQEAVVNLESHMRKTDEHLDNLVLQVVGIEHDLIEGLDDTTDTTIELDDVLQCVHKVKDNYQNLRKELMEVQHLQRQLSTTLQQQLHTMQMSFNVLKEKIGVVGSGGGLPPPSSPTPTPAQPPTLGGGGNSEQTKL